MRQLTRGERAELVGDLHTYGGAVLVAGGASWAYPPAGLIVFGAVLMWLGLFWRRDST